MLETIFIAAGCVDAKSDCLEPLHDTVKPGLKTPYLGAAPY